MRQMDDVALVQLAAAGRQAAQCELARRAYPRVLACCLARVRHRQDAEELTQETLLRAVRDVASLDHPERWAAWIRQIALHVCTDWIRRRRHVETVNEEWRSAVAAGDAPEVPVELQEEREAVQAGLLSLPEDLREVLMLYYFEDLTYEQVAAWLGVARATVSERLSRARQMLKLRLQPLGSPNT